MPNLQVDLAVARSISNWKPNVGDWMVWAGWFTQWHGIVQDYNPVAQTVTVVFGSMPIVVLTYKEFEKVREQRTLKMHDILSARPGVFSVLKYDIQAGTNIWYV